MSKSSIEAYKLKAFTAEESGGNTAGVVLDAQNLNTEEMQRIAAELGFSETAFISPSTVASEKLRFFTTVEEVDLCGHATIASWSLLQQLGKYAAGSYTQETRAGILGITVAKNGLIYMEQNAVTYSDRIAVDEVTELFNITAQDLHPTLMPQIASTGLPNLLVGLSSKTKLLDCVPNLVAIAEFSRRHDGDMGVHLFALLEGCGSLASTRNFDPLYGIDEESATGTANGALLCYLRDHQALPEGDSKEFRIEQGASMGQLSYIYGRFQSSTVWIGGRASQPERLMLRV